MPRQHGQHVDLDVLLATRKMADSMSLRSLILQGRFAMSALLYLLPLGLIFDLQGYMPPAMRLLLCYGLFALPLCLRPSARNAWLGAGLAVAAVVKCGLPLSPLAEAAWLLAMHQALWTRIAHGAAPRAAGPGLAAFALLWLAVFCTPEGLPAVEALTRAGNAISGILAGRGTTAFHLGPTFQGVASLGLFTTLGVFIWKRDASSTVRALLFPLLALLVNAVAAVLLLEKGNFVDKEALTSAFAWSWEFREPFGIAVLLAKLRDMVVVIEPGLLFLAHLALFLAIFGWHWWQADAPAAVARTWRERIFPTRAAWLAAAAALAVVAFVAPPTAWRAAPAREIVFVEKGVVSYTKPNDQQFGEFAGGMFGMMPEYARLYGFRTVVTKEIPAELRPDQMLALTSLDMDIGAETRERIWKFVAAGGRLWVLGDHTFIKDGRNHLNDLLDPCHIRFVNDSAELIVQGWFHSYRFMQGTPYANLRDEAENRPGILVGASLDLRVPAIPLVTGRFGYGDLGTDVPDPKQGHLGDFKYQRRERLGDLTLVAGEAYGAGRVLVFGDTSSFFNNNLARSHELLRANLAWLCENNIWLFPGSVAGRMLAALAVAALVAAAFIRRGTLPVFPALAAVAVAGAVIYRTPRQPAIDPAVARQRLALVDFSHQPNASKHTATDSGLHGVFINLMRHGDLPVAVNHWDPELLENARMLFLSAPRRPFSAGELAQLTRFMERGGRVVLTCGYPDTPGGGFLLKRFGIGVTATPLGRFFDRPAYGAPVSFMSAWELDKNLPAGARVICATPSGTPLMLSVEVGKGGLLVIGDSEFFHNRNLEGHKNHDPQNTRFFKNMLEQAAP